MAPPYSTLPSSPTTSSRSPSYPPSRPSQTSRPSSSSSFSHHSHTAASRSLPRRQNSSSQEMDAAFDDSGSDDDEDENVPLSRTLAASGGRATGGGGGASGGGGGTVVWSVDENGEEEEEGHIKQPTPTRNGTLQDPLRTAGSGETRTVVAGEGNLIGMDADEGGAQGGYDFDRDYFLPPPGSPPPGAYPEAYLPSGPTPLTTTPAYPRAPSASTRFIRSILPTHFTRSAAPPITRGSDGVFANIMAKPEVERPGGEGNGEGGGVGSDGENGAVMAEFTQKEGPPSYNVALRDAVPAYWEHNVVAPQLGPLGSFSGSGDDLLLDGLPIGNFFGFAWNLLVSLSFQFVGFLLTYVLHTTHAAKYGSRAGLGITLIQYGLYLRTRGEEIMNSGSLDPDVGQTNDAFGGGGWWGMSDENGVPSGGLATTTVAAVPTPTSTASLAIPTFTSMTEAEAWAAAHNTTVWEAMGEPNAMEVGEANEWLSFVLMSCGWFILLTSLGGYWRVKRFERSLLISQQTDAPPSTSNTNAEASTSSVNPTRSWFTPPGASSSSEGDDQPITTARGGQNPFQAMGQSFRGFTAGVRERMDIMRGGSGGGGRGGRRRDGEEEEELMLE